MAFAMTRHGGIRNHEKYKKAMDRLHKGDWKGALHDFEELLREYPDNEVLIETIEDTRFKAGFDSRQRIRPRRWIFRGGKTVGRVVLLIGIVVLLWQGYVLLQTQIAPILAARQLEQQNRDFRTQTLADFAIVKLNGPWDDVEVKLQKVLGSFPNDPEVLSALEWIGKQRRIVALYTDAVDTQTAGDCKSAIEKFTELQQLQVNYRDVTDRINQCMNEKTIAELLQSAAIYMQIKDYPEANIYYEQAKAQGAKQLPDGTAIDAMLSTIKFFLAEELMKQPPLNSDLLSEAMGYLQKALQLNPGNKSASSEKRLLDLFSKGQKAHYDQRWADAVVALSTLYSERPLYLKGQGIPLLYEDHLNYGDSLRGGEDCALAYEQYKRAAALPVEDTTAALARIDEVIACITPTVTPTETPTPTMTPAPTGTPRPTSTPMPLSFYRGKIVFKSDNPDKPGFYAMNPDGSGREFLAPLDYAIMQDQYDKLQAQYRWSPDGKTRAYVTKDDRGINQVWLETTDGSRRPRAITRLDDIAYDPQWSPDGRTILFVSQHNGSDDVWLINADESNMRWLINNDWEWDKWASWSPDSTQIVFWTNREGTKQIYVMDASGKGQHNISKLPFDEYDPLWIR